MLHATSITRLQCAETEDLATMEHTMNSDEHVAPGSIVAVYVVACTKHQVQSRLGFATRVSQEK